jgi:hypothetical protein
MMSNSNELMESNGEADEKPQKPFYSTAKKKPSTTYMDKVWDGV